MDNYPSRYVKRTCEVCGKEFVGGRNARFCPECYKEHRRAKNREGYQRRKAGVKLEKFTTRTCRECGAEFYGYCSRLYCYECLEKHHREKTKQLYHEKYKYDPERKARRLVYAAKWRMRNRWRCIEATLRWQKNNPDKVRENQKRRNLRRKMARAEYYERHPQYRPLTWREQINSFWRLKNAMHNMRTGNSLQ